VLLVRRFEGFLDGQHHGECAMIEMLEGFPESVLGFAAKGQVTRQDYGRVLIPAVEAALRRQQRIRLYYEIGPQCTGFDPGAMWEDTKLGFEHFSRWERVAVVTDIEWIRIAIDAFGFLMPGKVRVFATRETAEARAWVAAA
jgi:SpoIIAA-like